MQFLTQLYLEIWPRHTQPLVIDMVLTHLCLELHILPLIGPSQDMCSHPRSRTWAPFSWDVLGSRGCNKLQYLLAKVCWKTLVSTKLKMWAMTKLTLQVVMSWKCWEWHS